jgi:hypothetical protein
MFLSSMGITQLITAIIGGILGYISIYVFKESK